LKSFKQDIYDYIGLTMQLAIDAMEDAYNELSRKKTDTKILPLSKKEEKEREKEIKSLRAIYQEGMKK